jgi:catechol 2,3-dioxygenase-like lactoylglutathione lyase family enzyme
MGIAGAGEGLMAIAHITLATRDLARTRRFFAEALGWRPILRPNNVPFPAAWLEIAPGQELHLVEVTDFVPSPFEREYGRHVAVTWPRADMGDLKERLRKNGAELIVADRPTPFERFFFRDPNGYLFEVVAAERQPELDVS